jgi:MtrB/PioB family decaheme-associated outer membrane protein
VYVSGNYAFTPTTRSTFKLAYGRITQDAQFIVPPTSGITDSQLDGRIDTTLAQFGVTSRPIPKLSVVADVRYEDRDDKTPVRTYFSTTSATSTSNGENEPRSIKTTSAKAEANYALPEGFRVIGGVGWEEKKRNVSQIRVVSARETTEETTWRVELRRPMSETVTGSLAFLRSNRGGSDFLTTTLRGDPPAFTNGLPGSNLIAPIFLADRERDKVRVTVNWQPTNPLTVQLVADKARDDYEGRDPVLGPRKGEASSLSLDAAYVFSDRWQANAWYSRNDTSLDQTTCQSASGNPAVCPSTALTWSAAMRNLTDSFGIGGRGKLTGQIEIGADFSYSEIKDESNLEQVSGTTPVTTLPNITTKLTRLNLFARYALQKNSGVRLDYIFDRFETDDWTWPTWTFADGTRLTEPPTQKVSFIGVSYYYKFQ